MKRMKVFLMVWMVVMIGTMVKPVFADVLELPYELGDRLVNGEVEEVDRLQRLRYDVDNALKNGKITQEEADLIFETDKLFATTNEQRKEIWTEACKWALANTLELAKDPTIPIHQRNGFIESANCIKTTPGLKYVFNYDDVDLSLYRRTYLRKHHGCGNWVNDCYFYGYVKVKEKDLRKAANLWGYSFKEFVRRAAEAYDSYVFSCGRIVKTMPIPVGALMRYKPAPEQGCPHGHVQLSLGKFGNSSEGRFRPEPPEIAAGAPHYVGWDLPVHWRNWIGFGASRGVFHLPKYTAWFGIEVKVLEEREIVVTKVYPQSPAEKAGIKEGDVVSALTGGSIGGKNALENLQRKLRDIAEFQEKEKSGHRGDTWIKRDGNWVEISDQEISVEIRKRKGIPPGSY